MPPFKRTNIYKAAEAMELVAEGKSTYQAATLTDLPQRTVHDIVAGKHNWKAIANDPLFAEHRLQVKRNHQVAMNTIIDKGLVRMDETIETASFRDAAWGTAVMVDKERLLAGEATQNVAVLNRHEIAGRSEALRNLLASMGISTSDAESGHGVVDVEYSRVNGEDAKSNT